MQPMLVVTQDNFEDLLAINVFMATGGLGPKAEEVELSDTTVTNRSLAWQTEESETAWFKLTAWGELSAQLAELAPGTPTIAVGKVSTSEKDEKSYLNYTVDKILYLPKSTKTAPKKAVDPEKGKVSAAAIGSIDFSL
jgi:single-stranded DNA-binding protein